jgi:hypothetical protein
VTRKAAVMDNQSKGDEINAMMLKGSYPYPLITMISVIKYPVTGVHGNEVVNNFHFAGTFGRTKTQLCGRIHEIRSDRPLLSWPKSRKK